MSRSISTKWNTEFAAYTHHEKHECCALITVKAEDVQVSSQSRVPVDIVAVIDKSGSMSGEKIEMVKNTLKIIINDRECVCTHISNVLFPHVYIYYIYAPTKPFF